MMRYLCIVLVLLLCGCSGEPLTFAAADDGFYASLSGESYTMEATLPALGGAGERWARRTAQGLARQFLKDYARRVEELEAEGAEAADQQGAWVLNGEATGAGELESLALVEYRFLPGSAHGDYAIRTATFRGRQRVELKDILAGDPYEQLSVLSRELLLDSGQLGDYADPVWIQSGTEPCEANFSAWLATPEGLMIIFAPYQIGPWVLGEQRITLDWDRLELK